MDDRSLGYFTLLHSALSIIVAAALLVGCGRSSCVSEANATTASALAAYRRSDLARAATLQRQSALNLLVCLQDHPHEMDSSSQQRSGELWMYAGDYTYRAGNAQEAKRYLGLAKRIFAWLRTHAALQGTSLDEVLLDAHEVDRDLDKIRAGAPI